MTLALSGTLHADPAPDAAEGIHAPGRILVRVFELLDSAGIPYCVLHGYEAYPDRIESDVDCVVGADLQRILVLLDRERSKIGADVVYRCGHYIVLSARSESGSPSFLALDLAPDCAVGDLPLYSGAEVLAGRRSTKGIWVPASSVAFCAYLARSIVKGALGAERTQRLTELYRQDPLGTVRELDRFWTGRNKSVLQAAASSGKCNEVQSILDMLQDQLWRSAVVRYPGRFISAKAATLFGRVRRLAKPDGMSVVLLGPDGAGKSSTIKALATCLGPAFPRQEVRGFAPSLARLLGRHPKSTAEPHALPARSLMASLVRAAYWLAYYAVGRIELRIALARFTLVLYDRHFGDILVDPTRYRYGGPAWLLRFIWRVMPKPDLVVLLDASPKVLQARKQEVPFAETARQREAYLTFVRSLPNGRIVDASQPLSQVTAEVSGLILQHCSARREYAGQPGPSAQFDVGQASSVDEHIPREASTH